MLLLIFVNIFIYALVAVSVRKSSHVSVGLCNLHITKRRKTWFIGFSVCFGALVVAQISLYAQQNVLAALAFLAAFTALVATSFMSRV